MPPRRSFAQRSKVFPGSPSKASGGSNHVNAQGLLGRKNKSSKSMFADCFVWLTTLWERINGNVLAYFCFLTIFSLVIRSTQGGDDRSYLMVQSIIGQVEGGFDSTDYTVYPVIGKKNFGIRDIGNLDDLWEWLSPGQFIGIFFPEEWYEGGATDGTPQQRWFNQEYRFIGQLSLRQVRVKQNSCKIPTSMQVLNISCYAEYGEDAEDHLPFPAAAAAAEALEAAENSTSAAGPGSAPALSLNSTLQMTQNSTAPSDSAPADQLPVNVLKAVRDGLVYQDAASMGSRTHLGLYTWYYGGGYRVMMPNDEADAKLVLDQLKAYKWLDSATRALFVTFYVYSNALQTLAFVQYVIELPAAGGAVVSGKVQCMKLSQLYFLDETINAIALEGVMLFGVLIYIAVELRLMYVEASSLHCTAICVNCAAVVPACNTVPMYSQWPVGRLAACVERRSSPAPARSSHSRGTVLYAAAARHTFRIFIFAYIARFRALLLARDIKFPAADDEKVSYEDPAFWIRQFTSILAINCIITWMKMLKFCKNVPAMTHIINVITHCLPLMANFMLLFLVIFSGFAFAHLLAYGDTIDRFKDASSAFYSMYRVLVGDFNFMEMFQNNRIIGPAFLLMWTMIGLTVLFNVFVAILMESYEATKTETVGFVDMVADNLMKPLAQKIDRMFQFFKKEGRVQDDVNQDQDENDAEQRQDVALQPDASKRLQRKKAAAEAQAAEAVIEGYEAQALLNQQLLALAVQIGEADSRIDDIANRFASSAPAMQMLAREVAFMTKKLEGLLQR